MVFHRSQSDKKSPQVSRIIIRILVDLSNAVVLIVSTRPLILKSTSHFTNRLVGRLFGFYGISTFVGYLMPNPFLCKIIGSISNNSV